MLLSADDISMLKYRSEKIRPILLLHNIQTMLNNENETKSFFHLIVLKRKMGC